KRYDLVLADKHLFRIREYRDAAILHEVLACRQFQIDEGRRTMADRGHDAAVVVHLPDDPLYGFVAGEVPHRSMSAGKVDRVIVRGIDVLDAAGIVDVLLRLFQEPT